MIRLLARPLLACLAAVLALCVLRASGPQQAAPAPEAAGQARLLQLQREATAFLKQASRADAPADAKQRAVREAAKRLEALGAEGPASSDADVKAGKALPPPLRSELLKAARQ